MTHVIDSNGRLKVVVSTQVFNKTTVTAATYTPTVNDCVIYCNSAAAQTINLPAATGSGIVYYIKQIGTGAVTLDANGAELIDGQLTQTLVQWDDICIQDGGTGTWYIL